ncbi:MAG TPA: hypothetical protein VF070_04190 [Streptosporangiaceae bacterium]
MSKKNRQRRIAPVKADSTAQLTDAVDDLFDQLLAELWPALRSDDVLKAEVATARCLAVGRLLGIDPDKSDSIFVKMATQSKKPEDAALLRIITLLGSPAVKRSASRALAEVTASGVYPADWVTQVGRAAPVQAWVRDDTFGDEEMIVVTYRYGDSEHAISVHVDRSSMPMADFIALITDTDDLVSNLEQPSDDFKAAAPISLAEARRRLELALANTKPGPELPHDTIALLPVLRSRLRRLPASGEQPAQMHTAADRTAAVDEFMKSPEAAGAVAADEESTRFWAGLLAAFSSRLPDEPPAQLGPAKLEFMLTAFVPRAYAVSESQRRHARPAVTAWARWSAACRGLDEGATQRLLSEVPAAVDAFEIAYDNPAFAAERGYTADIAVREADVVRIGEHAVRRQFALPKPEDRLFGGESEALDAGDPVSRRVYAEAEFADCDLPEGTTREEFLVTVHRVIEELWTGEPPATWEQAQSLLDSGKDRHDVIHDLVQRSTS